MMTLDELKEFVEAHLKKELKIMEMLFLLEKKDVEEFTRWYKNHPYCKGIDEIKELVGKRAGNTEDKEDCNGFTRPRGEKNGN
jgi:hypothetical protein